MLSVEGQVFGGDQLQRHVLENRRDLYANLPQNVLDSSAFAFADNKPSFGPSHIYFYEGFHRNAYFGKLLLSIETEDIDDRVVGAFRPKEDIVMPLNTSEYWDEEIFKINIVIVNGDALNVTKGHVKVYLACENTYSNSIELETKDYDGNVKLKFVLL